MNGRTGRVPINFCRKSEFSADPHPDFFRVKPGDLVEQGQRLASGRVKLGDHIFVDKIRYNFLPPRRGNIIVFDTKTIHYPGVRTDSFYIKRLVGLPGETIALEPPHLVADGKKIEQPYPFWRMLNDREFMATRWLLTHPWQPELPADDPAAGRGYIMPGPNAFLSKPGEGRKLTADEYLPMGDNTFSSLDGRYFGPVRKTELVGPAFMVYWPLTKRWGLAR
ncbi:MAG: signal peptidase I [Kiritimatiellaeota bacterium]|nr:signal peptidase I [Kiritimatiellota bacterium]